MTTTSCAVYTENGTVVSFFGILQKDCLYNVGFLEVFGGPGGFRMVREAEKKNVHQFPSTTHGRVPVYDKKINNLTTNKATTISMRV